ncbi:Predicted secreted Zn-dependent protease [Legionella steigerwaltii]|uniref:Predicted secreted Zn-dependent protease n=1 Tax=Legionella steigerwaltii TaxID=460 RepID=A0A378LE97_9GAMM|nr:DUF922 domain-containing Zn-dependent protease [Legionella steigerwaltii]KTD78552.1 hypothetical protein Lstg_1287 [Legionella steigerwaltii]STY24089.1 Predicted secreted Zn-dependent protease [Legionella steigerwaltii]
MKKFVFILIHFVVFNAKIFATPVIYTTQTFYKITGTTEQELRNQLNQLGPFSTDQRYDAKTSWYINWDYKWHYDNPSKNPCYLTEVKVTADIVTILPEWENKEYGSAESQLKWENYLVNLSKHEEGHENNGKEVAAEIDDALLRIAPMPSCEMLQSTIENTAQSILKKHNRWDINYDATTQHGRTQGAFFP